MSKETLNQLRSDLFCEFCGKQCKNLNSLTQHSVRCKLNPNRVESAKRDFKKQYQNLPEETKRRMAWSRGKTAETNDSIKRMVEHLPKHHQFEYIYILENQCEIDKWKNYLMSKQFVIPLVETITTNEGYKVVRRGQSIQENTVRLLFEHKYIANILLNGNLLNTNCVHHIDSNRANNDMFNLLVFATTSDHKRFHNSKYAKLQYDENSHLFYCIVEKE